MPCIATPARYMCHTDTGFLFGLSHSGEEGGRGGGGSAIGANNDDGGKAATSPSLRKTVARYFRLDLLSPLDSLNEANPRKPAAV